MLKGVAILFHKRDSLFRECWILTGRGVSRKDRGTTFMARIQKVVMATIWIQPYYVYIAVATTLSGGMAGIGVWGI